jgi:hypothetical protein
MERLTDETASKLETSSAGVPGVRAPWWISVIVIVLFLLFGGK